MKNMEMQKFFNKYGSKRILIDEEENIVLHLEEGNGWFHAPQGAIGSIYVSVNNSTEGKIEWVFEGTLIPSEFLELIEKEIEEEKGVKND